MRFPDFTGVLQIPDSLGTKGFEPTIAVRLAQACLPPFDQTLGQWVGAGGTLGSHMSELGVPPPTTPKWRGFPLGFPVNDPSQ